VVQDRFVGRARLDPAAVPHDAPPHPRQGPVGGLRPPESPARHHGDLGARPRLERHLGAARRRHHESSRGCGVDGGRCGPRRRSGPLVTPNHLDGQRPEQQTRSRRPRRQIEPTGAATARSAAQPQPSLRKPIERRDVGPSLRNRFPNSSYSSGGRRRLGSDPRART
jgi:hypothetical protein